MRVLFVFSGNKQLSGPIRETQAESLREQGVEVDHFIIIGQGFQGYIKNVPLLRKKLREKHYDVIHAHYSLSAMLATLSGAEPLVVSLMGSDVYSQGIRRIIIRIFKRVFWKTCLVKSEEMRNILKIRDLRIIPNGVNLSHFRLKEKKSAKELLHWSIEEIHILFGANPIRPEKNYKLFLKAIQLIQRDEIEIHELINIPYFQVPDILCASDIVVLTSLWEGSPNIIKEAMACNCPAVATKVGDIGWLFENEPGYYLTSFDPEDVAHKLKLAIQYAIEKGRTNGRRRIIELRLDSKSVAKRIAEVYEDVKFTK